MRILNAGLIVLVLVSNVHAKSLPNRYATGKDQLFFERVQMATCDLFPSSYEEFNEGFKYVYDYADAQCAMSFVKSVRAEDYVYKVPRRMVFVDQARAYRIAWEVGLRVWKNTSSEEAKDLIKQEWEKALSLDDGHVAVQICALAMVWDEAFLTDRFWEIVSKSRTPEIIQSVCYVLYVDDSKTGMQVFRHERKKINNQVCSDMLESATDWINYSTSNIEGKIAPGVPAMSPRLTTCIR